jgi:hypothetical protein
MAVRERFVPRRVDELTADLADLPWPTDEDGDRFRALARLVSALHHYEFHDREQRAIEAWEAAGDDPAAASALHGELTGLLDQANYTRLTMAELDDALARESLLPLRLEVDVSDYEELLVCHRGSHRTTVRVPRWWGLRSRERTVTVDDRVVVYARVRPQAWFDEQGRDPADRNLRPGHISLKQFQNVPRADVEMLLPSAQVRLRPIDTVMVGLPALVSGLAVALTKLLPTIGLIVLLVGAWLGLRDEEPQLDQASLVVLFGGVITLGGFFVRQWSKLKNRRLEYLKTLNENLFFRTLGDGPGVIHTLLASAEEQEVVEVLLAYRFLVDAPDGHTAESLDRAVEAWLAASCRRDVDFEIDDAVAKLRDHDLVEGTETLRAVPLPGALTRLDRRWDDLFHHPATGP